MTDLSFKRKFKVIMPSSTSRTEEIKDDEKQTWLRESNRHVQQTKAKYIDLMDNISKAVKHLNLDLNINTIRNRISAGDYKFLSSFMSDVTRLSNIIKGLDPAKVIHY
jgi:hypothetical protein